MKNIFFAAIAVLLLASCSNDDAAAGEILNTNGTILKKMVVTEHGNVTFFTDFIYLNGKLVKTSNSDGRSYLYTNTGNLITKIDFFENNIQKGTQLFEYDTNERLIVNKRLNTALGTGYKITYSYNDDGSIVDVAVYMGDLTNQTTLVKTKIAYLENGQVTKLEEFHEGNLYATVKYTYDDKNSPYNGIPGYNKLLSYDIGVSGNHNNVTEYEYTDDAGNTNTDSFLNFYNIYNYATTSFPPVSLNQAETHYYYL